MIFVTVEKPVFFDEITNRFLPIATLMDFAGLELDGQEAEDSVSWRGLLTGHATDRGVPVIHHSAAGMFAVRALSLSLSLVRISRRIPVSTRADIRTQPNILTCGYPHTTQYPHEKAISTRADIRIKHNNYMG